MDTQTHDIFIATLVLQILDLYILCPNFKRKDVFIEENKNVIKC